MAAIALSCSRCSNAFRVISDQAGRKVRCPHCGTVNLVHQQAFAAGAAPAPVAPPAQAAPTPDAAPPENGRLAELAEELRRAERRTALAPLRRSRFRYSHSPLASITNIVAYVLLLCAIATEFYVIFVTEWRQLARLPLDVALPAFAATFLPAGILALTGLTFLVYAHGLEYLARISANTQVARRNPQ